MSEKITGRKLKGRVLDLLLADDPIESVRKLSLLPAREVMNPLFSFLYNENENIFFDVYFFDIIFDCLCSIGL